MRALLKHKEFILLSIVLIIGAYLRFRGIFDMSFAYTYDVGRDMLAVGKIVHTLDLPLIGPTTGLPGLFYGPWWYYFLVPSFIVGSGNPQAVAGFIAITGLLATVLGYVLGKRIHSSTLGLLIASFFSFSPVMVGLTAQIWNPNLAPLLLTLLLLILLPVLSYTKGKGPKLDLSEKKGIGLFILLGFLAGLNIDAEVVYGLLLTLSLFIFLVFMLRKRILPYLFVLVGLGLAFAPRILFELKHGFIMTRTLFANISSGKTDSPISFDPTQLLKSFIALKDMWDETLALNNELLGWMLLLLTGVLVIKSYKSLHELAKQLVLFILFAIGVYLVGLSFFRGELWSHYIVGLPALFILLFCIAMAYLIQKSRLKHIGLATVLLLLILHLQPKSIIAYYTQPQWIGDASLYRNQLEVIEYIYKQADGESFNRAVYTPPVHDYTYEYLFQWYGKKTYGYIPSEGKERLFFVIVEPDPGYEFRQESWLNLRKEDGKIVRQQEFPSGIIVQTRTH